MQKKLIQFFSEKNLPSVVFQIPFQGVTHFVESEFVIELIYLAPASEQNQIYKKLVYLDFRNANILDFLKHLAKGYIHQEYSNEDQQRN